MTSSAQPTHRPSRGRTGYLSLLLPQNTSADRVPGLLRQLVIDALVGSVVELARLAATPTPHIDTVYALVKLLARSMAHGHGALRLQQTA